VGISFQKPHRLASFYGTAVCVLEIHPGTAPQEPLHRDGSRYCLSGGLIFVGLGAFDYLSRICDATFEKRSPQPGNLLMVLSKC
jgi:hypothetical protein